MEPWEIEQKLTLGLKDKRIEALKLLRFELNPLTLKEAKAVLSTDIEYRIDLISLLRKDGHKSFEEK